MKRSNLKYRCLIGGIALMLAPFASADLVVTFYEEGRQARFSGTGSFITDGIAVQRSLSERNPGVFARASSGTAFMIGQGGTTNQYFFGGSWSGDLTLSSTSGWVADFSGRWGANRSVLYTSADYVSGAPINISASHASSSLADLGLVDGSMLNWTSAGGANRVIFVVDADGSSLVAAVPEPSSFLLGLLALLPVFHRRRRNVTSPALAC